MMHYSIPNFTLSFYFIHRRNLVDPMLDSQSEKSYLLAPFGSASCFDVTQGELVYCRRPGTRQHTHTQKLTTLMLYILICMCVFRSTS